MPLPTLTVKAGREKPVRGRHPWIFSGAAAHIDAVEPGGLVDIRDGKGRFLARGYANPHSKILARILTWDEGETIDAAFWLRRVAAAVARRSRYLSDEGETACRLVMSEADLLPGLTVDKYGSYIVVQALTAGIDRYLQEVTDALEQTLRPAGIFERSDDQVRDLEGLPRVTRTLRGQEPPEGGVEVRVGGLRFVVDLHAGHKTGFYLDQRQAHLRLRREAAGRDALDCFSYAGGFTVNLAHGGAASVLSVDASEPALARLSANLAANGFGDDPRFTQRAGDAFELLRLCRDRGDSFDLIILDPPKFAHNAAQVDKAARGYKDINLLAFKLLRPGGLLATFSCSGHIGPDLFQKIIYGAALDAGRDAQIVDHLFQAEDHPVLLTFPESLYLKGLLCRVL